MSTIKLTDTNRNGIRRRALKHAFGEVCITAMDANMALVDAMWRDINGADLARMDTLPDGWLGTEDDFRVKIAGCIVNMSFNGALQFDYMLEPRLDVHRRIKHDQRHGVLAVYDGGHELADGYAAIRQRTAEINGQMRRAVASMNAVLNQASTVARLLVLWPEVAPFLPDQAPPKPTLPALPIADLNAMLGLPVQE